MAKEKSCDVLILGAGMAGSCLARQLRLQEPDLKIVVVERKKTFDWWVGESTVEAWEDYMVRVLRLGPMLEKNFLVKHGQRFFFDSAAKDLPMDRMSELGRVGYHPLAARQVDRALFDRLMVEENRALGVEVRLGVSVAGPDAIRADPRGGHRVATSAGTIRCRWLVDATGRGSILARKFALVAPDDRHQTVSYWSRYENTAPIDELGGDEWRRRVWHTSRWSSTNHFMYRGYWVWLIPISDRIVSVGVEGKRDMGFAPLRDGAELERFLRSHRALDQILGPKAKRLDFMGLTRLPRCASRRFSEDRWFLAGMAGHFVEVLGSGTSRLYTEVNRMIGALIRADREGDERRYRARAKHFDVYLRRAYEASIRDLGDYRRQGSYDLWSPYYGARLASYFNARLPLATSDLSTLIRTADEHGPDCACAFEPRSLESGFSAGLRRLADGYREFADRLGVYYSGNEGRFTDLTRWEQRPAALAKIYEPPSAAREEAESRALYRENAWELSRRAAEHLGAPLTSREFERRFDPDWDSGQTLEELVSGAPRPRRAARAPRAVARR
jgi:flavin-dependent dehydrogenase